MKLKLFWKSKENIHYELGILSYNQDEYIFTINYIELKKAASKGCYGIGNFDLKQIEYRSKKLFDFFVNRLPEKKEIDEIVEKYNISPNDMMKILEISKGKKYKDNYYLERDV